MKYHSMLTLALTSLCLLCLLTSQHALAGKPDRWFEIEVILFKQLANNSAESEAFSPRDLSAKKRRAFDLLTPYLQPEISALRHLLPNCEQQAPTLPFNITPKTLWTDNVVDDGNDAEEVVLELSDLAKHDHVELPIYNKYPTSSQTPFCMIPAEFFQQHLTAQQLEHFNIDGFPVEKLANTVNGIEQWQDDESGQITWASDKPYLISRDSFRLKSIANRIKRSRNYKPLLHLGWRQIGESRRHAQAMKLYAGDNLALRYQQAITKQASEQLTLEIQELVAQSTVNASETNSALTGNENINQQAKQQALDSIFQQFTVLNNQSRDNASTSVNDSDEAQYSEAEVNRIVAQLSTDIAEKSAPLSANNSTATEVDITAPAQPWSIDGLVKVHLKNNRYLYIETELNIVDAKHKTSVLNAKQKLSNKSNKSSGENKVISFKQDRRVITGEIHYFDHPHIGMIVQIRRFDPTKPANQAVTQAKK